MKKIVVLSFISVVLFTNTYSQLTEPRKIDSLLVRLTKSKEDTNKVNLFVGLMKAHVYYKAEEGLKYEKPSLELAKKLNWTKGICDVKYAAGRIYWRLNKFDEALKHHFDALKIAEKSGYKELIFYTNKAIAQDYADHSNYPEAHNYLNKALAIAKETGNKKYLAVAHALISWVYTQQGNYPESAKNTYIALKLNEELGDRNSAAVQMSVIGRIYMNLDNDSLALKYLDTAAVIMKEENSLINLAGIYMNIGIIHEKHSEFSEALKFLELAQKTIKGTNDMRQLANVNTRIAEHFVNIDNDTLALKYYLSIVQSLKSLEDNQAVAYLYIEIGNCFTRLNKYSEAKTYFDDAFALSKIIESEEVSYQYHASVELLDSATGNWKDAYNHYKTSMNLYTKLHNDENTKKIMQTSMQYEFDKKEAAAKADQEKKDIRQRTIRNSIAGVLVGALIFLVVVYRQRNKISKARKRSDELLLNILPGEVAEELKEKGSADAKHFDEVTVMFTDFKGFTQISEKLSPAELVAEIHNCFKAFDNIIEKHNIEKIKTIGDSYMCAGGLPVTNTTNAVDVVNAALDIQQFMQQHFQQRKNENKEPFEIRIGVHTGAVVAGIVGVKKFAYDIWGDTVNIASRMETSGEAGKVNISGSTYELVRDKFSCTHRGKIQAKNKGEIDMYFVDTVS